MSGRIAAVLAEQGIELPQAPMPAANYVPVVISGRKAFTAGQVCSLNGSVKYIGQLGGAISIEEGQAAARLCGLNIVAQLQAALGDLDRVTRIVKLTVFVNAVPGFADQPKVANGASDLMVSIFGAAGKHARSAVGVSALPLGAAVEIDAVVEIDAAVEDV